MRPSGETNEAVQFESRTVAPRTRSSHAWSSLVLSAAFALREREAVKGPHAFVGLRRRAEEHHQRGGRRVDRSRHGKDSVNSVVPRRRLMGAIIATFRRVRMRGMTRVPVASARPELTGMIRR